MMNETVEMADKLRENGKIYVVIAVVVVIFLSLVAYLFYQDRKIKQIEEKLKQKN
ncbi:MAG: hypothetical protein KatS3mg027_2022 [Bacteroidia bacterium]|nr:MAG: hypothetical protein KatS3mg027_2022 [Bacteroidia bacterium]